MNKCLRNGYQLYVIHVEELSIDMEPRIEEILVLQKFQGVFPKVPRLPRKRDIDFTIDMVPRTMLVSRDPHIMSTPQLKEWKLQLEELLKKGYMHPSVLP